MAVMIDNLQIEIQTESTKAVSSLNRLIDTLKDLKAACAGGAGLGAVVKQLERLNKALNGQGASDSLGKVSKSAKRATEDVKNYAMAVSNYAMAVKNAAKAAKDFQSSSNPLTKYNGFNTYDEGIQSRVGGASTPLLDNPLRKNVIDVEWREVSDGVTATGAAVTNLDEELEKMNQDLPFSKTAIGEVNQANIDMLKSTMALQSPLGKIANHFANITRRAKGSSKSLGQVLSSLKRIAMYRLLRTALKAIGDVFSEGLSNAYQYSKVVGTELAPALDHLASVHLKMKNQLGALAGQLLIAIMPLLTRLISFVTKLADRLTEVMAALNGNPTYQKAKDISIAWEEATDSVKAYRQQLLGLDELNVLNTQNSGSGTDTPNFEDMFEDVPVRDSLKWLGTFKLNFDDVLFNWDNFDPTTKILPGILGLFAGITAFTLTGSALGALTASVFGVALGTLINTLWFDKDANFTDETEAWKQQIADIVKAAACGAAAGALIGFAVGGPAGAAFGAKIGAGLTVVIQSLVFKKSSKLKKNPSEAIDEITEISQKAIPEGIKFTPKTNSVGMTVGSDLTYKVNNVTTKKGSAKKTGPEAISELTDVSKQIIPQGIAFDNYSNSINMAVGASVDYRINKINMKKGSGFEVTGASLVTDSISEALKSAQTASVSTETKPKVSLPTAPTMTSIQAVNGSGISGDKMTKEAKDSATLGTFLTSPYGLALTGAAAAGLISVVGGAAAAAMTADKASKIAAAGASSAEVVNLLDYLAKKASGFANGGIPTQGTLFYAGESGPEFVGNMGGSSAVANTDQMSEAIEQAAYRGVSRAMQENNNTVVLSPDADKIFNITRQKGREYTRMTGQSWAY